MKPVLKHYSNTRVFQGAAPAPNPPPQKMLCQKRPEREKMIARTAKRPAQRNFISNPNTALIVAIRVFSPTATAQAAAGSTAHPAASARGCHEKIMLPRHNA